ncbi:MAG TPA: hypothetical protein VKT32_03705 [Chthonomonadaceae bacterium]|nr:hypothetical protein [Chthonomonadaceae bacterium]
MKLRTILFLFLGLFLLSRGAWAAPPEHLGAADVEALSGEKEDLSGRFAGLLFVPRGALDVTEDKYGQPFHAACYAYVAERAPGSEVSGPVAGYDLRFAVYAPDADSLPLAKRVSRLLVLLIGEARARLRYNPPSDMPVVSVWLTRQAGQGLSADVGGEQFKDQIYLYDIYSARKPIEWAREVAHEYGHFSLPGISGYTAPEEWANGVLGERLYLKWLREDLRAGRLHPEEVPFVTPDMLQDYLARQVDPLIRRVAREGVDEHEMGRRSAAGMDAFTALALYLDTVYGSKALMDAFAYTLPQQGGFIHGTDFMRGVYASLSGVTDLTVTPPSWSRDERSAGFSIYLPRGEFHASAEGPVHSWSFPADAKGIHLYDRDSFFVGLAGWQKLSLTLSRPEEAPPHLIFHRQGTDVR